jgi:hypothetical protein
MSIEYLLPTSAPRTCRRYELALDSTRAPRRIGLLANGFPDADKYLEKQAKALARIWPSAEFRIEKKANHEQLNIGIQEPLLSEMANACDAVVIAWGHCGSCTSGVARDAIAFAERGVPSVMLICEVFWDYSDWIGTSLGMSGLARVKLPFPISGTGDNNQIECAERSAAEIVRSLSRH